MESVPLFAPCQSSACSGAARTPHCCVGATKDRIQQIAGTQGRINELWRNWLTSKPPATISRWEKRQSFLRAPRKLHLFFLAVASYIFQTQRSVRCIGSTTFSSREITCRKESLAKRKLSLQKEGIVTLQWLRMQSPAWSSFLARSTAVHFLARISLTELFQSFSMFSAVWWKELVSEPLHWFSLCRPIERLAAAFSYTNGIRLGKTLCRKSSLRLTTRLEYTEQAARNHRSKGPWSFSLDWLQIFLPIISNRRNIHARIGHSGKPRAATPSTI